jgi:MoaA/NifB/PqqE/SkfB family radical SAM enzyme
VTNGSHLHQARVRDALVESALRCDVDVRVSLNAGTAPTHERLHRAPGAFDLVIEGMRGLRDAAPSGLRLGVSFLVEDANAREIDSGYRIAATVGADFFALRPKTGPRGTGLVPLLDRAAVLRVIRRLSESAVRPTVDAPREYLEWLATGRGPSSAKPYPACWFCGLSRLVVSPPGEVWSCTYWRGDERFRVADLREAPLGSTAFERARLAAHDRIVPGRDCAGVQCNRHRANLALWSVAPPEAVLLAAG